MAARADIDQTLAETVERDGFVVVPDALAPERVHALANAVASLSPLSRAEGIHARGHVYGVRNLFALVPFARDVLREPVLRDVVEAVLGADAFCVRAIFLDRSPRAGGRGPWRQDATITVKGRIDVTGFGSWTIKDGVQHVMAPPGTLSAMLTLRIHLDDSREGEGMLNVVPTSHQYGRLPEDSIEQFTRYGVVPLAVSRGGLVALHPLLLRRAEAAPKPGPRRVLQLDFAARRLPLPLEWHEAHAIG
jgi:hypothetical protein